MHFFKIFFWRKIGKCDSEMRKKQYFNKKVLFKDVDFAQDLLIWVILYYTDCRGYQEFCEPIFESRICTITKSIAFFSREKGHQVCKQVRGYTSPVVTLKLSRALPLPCFKRNQTRSCTEGGIIHLIFPLNCRPFLIFLGAKEKATRSNTEGGINI